MELGSTPYATLLVVTALVAGAIAVFAWRHRQATSAVELGVLMGAASAWALLAAIEVATSDPGTKLLCTRFQYVAIAAAPVVWVAFAVRYTGRGQLSRREGAALSAVPAATAILALSNPIHGLVWYDVGISGSGAMATITKTYGPWFWVHAAYSYALLAVGTGLLAHSFVLSEHLYRWQSAALMGGCLAPWIANVLYITDIVEFGVDPTPTGLTVTGVLFASAVFRHRLFDVVPAAREVARDELIESMAEGAIVLDGRDRIVDANHAAEIALDRPTPDLVGRSLAAASGPVAAAVERARANERRKTTLSLRSERGTRHYDVRVSALRRGYGAVTGSLVGLVDVTERRRREQRLDVQNRLLRHNLRNEMNVVQGNAALAAAETTNPEVRDRVETISATARAIVERSRKLKRFDREAAVGTGEPVRLTSVLEGVCNTIEERYPNARVVAEIPEHAPEVVGSALAIAFEELLANAITHNDRADPSVWVTVRDGTHTRSDDGVVEESGVAIGNGVERGAVVPETESRGSNGATREPNDDGPAERIEGAKAVSVRIADDGSGIPAHEIAAVTAGEETALEHASSIGLWIVAWIVRGAGGDVAFETGESGSTVTVTLPRADGDPNARPAETETGAIDG